MSETPTYQTLDQHLVAVVPEVRVSSEALRRGWGDETPGPRVDFGDVLNPHLLKLLASSEPTPVQSEELGRIFSFLKRLAHSDDVLIQEVVSTTVAERLGGDPT